MRIGALRLEKAADKQTDECDTLFQEFKHIFNQHDAAEDKIVYPALKNYPQLDKLIHKGYQTHHVRVRARSIRTT